MTIKKAASQADKKRKRPGGREESTYRLFAAIVQPLVPLTAESRTILDIGTVIRAVDRPVNVLAGSGGQTLGVAELAALGVRRISVGGLLSSVAYGALLHAAREIMDHGTFGFVDELKRAKGLRALLAKR